MCQAILGAKIQIKNKYSPDYTMKIGTLTQIQLKDKKLQFAPV